MSQHDRPLTPALPEDLEWTLSYALQFDGRKHFKTSHEMMAKITAAHLIECLRKSGFVVMKTPPPPLPPECAFAKSAIRAMEEGRKAAGGDSQGEA